MPEMTEEEAFDNVFNKPADETPGNDVDTLQVDDSVSDVKDADTDQDPDPVDVDDEIVDPDDSVIPPIEQEPLNYQELYEQSLTTNETLKNEVETANKRQSDTQKNWHEMNSRLKELEDNRSENVLPPVDQDEKTAFSELQEDFPELADSLEGAMEEKIEALRKKRELETQQATEKAAQREEAHYKALEDTKYGIPGFREKCRTPKFEKWAKSNPDHEILFEELTAEQGKDEFSSKVLQIKSSIMNRFLNSERLIEAKKQRKSANEKHKEAVLDMSTQVPTNRNGSTVKGNVPLTAKEEEEAGFLSVFS